jgi:class 3 adenylate cyclase
MEAERRQVTVLFTDVVGLPRCSASRAIVAIAFLISTIAQPTPTL